MDACSKAWPSLWRGGSNPFLREEGSSLQSVSRRWRQLPPGMESISHRFTTPKDQWKSPFHRKVQSLTGNISFCKTADSMNSGEIELPAEARGLPLFRPYKSVQYLRPSFVYRSGWNR